MAKKIVAGVITGGILINILNGTVNVGAYSGETFYPENEKVGLMPTMIDIRGNKISAAFKFDHDYGQVFKGLKFFEGEIDDDLLNLVYPGEDHGVLEYLTYDYQTEGWEDIPTSREFTLETEVPLGGNMAGTLGFTYLFWSDAYSQAMNMYRGRINYSRCINSAVFQENEEAVCRAELWEDGKLHYRPYVGWERLALADDPEEDKVLVYREDSWRKLSNEEEGPEEVSEVAETEDESEKTRIVEVPVEKEVVKEVPVEKKVTEIKEVVREVPVFANILADSQGPELEADTEVGDSDNDVEEDETEEDSPEENKGLINPDDVELPELGREDNSRDWTVKLATFSAGLVSAVALLVLAVVFRKKKQSGVAK